MKTRRVLAVTRKSLAQFRHDRRTLGFVIGMPLLMVLVFGYTFGGEVHDVRTLVVNDDQEVPLGPTTFHFAQDILENLEGETLTLVAASDLAAAREEVRAGRAWAVLHFPANFTENVVNRTDNEQGILDIILDGSSPPIASAILGRLRAAIEKALGGSAGAAPIALERDYVYGSEDTRFIDSFAPGVVALAVLMVTTIFSVIIVVREKSAGMLERLFATPLTSTELVFGHALALLVIAFLQSAVVLTAAIVLFQVQVVGSLVLAFALLLLFAAGNQGLGMMLSAGARNELQAVQLIPLILFPSLLLTGVFFPLEAIPGGLRPLSYVVPLTYAADGLRSVMLRGWGVAEIALDLVVLVGYDVLTLLGAAVLVRRQA